MRTVFAIIFAIAVSLATETGIVAAQEQKQEHVTEQKPLVPVVSFLHHWDHHWYIWLPGDPRFEAVEIMAAERGPGTAPLVWIFFTERAGAKHQVHCLNDARFAAAQGVDFRDIAFTMEGPVGGARDVSARFTDRDGRPVAITAQFDPDAKLSTTGAGLTNQIGHSGDRLLLIFFREKNVFARQWRVEIAGVDVATPQPGQNHPVPFPAAYSSNIFVAGLPFRERRVDFGADSVNADHAALHFLAGEAGIYVAALPDASRVELVAGPDGALAFYRQHAGEHRLEIAFDPPLPSGETLRTGVNSAYSLSLDEFRDLFAGTVQAHRQGDDVLLDWHFTKPDWARAHPLRSAIHLQDGHLAMIELRPLPQ